MLIVKDLCWTSPDGKEVLKNVNLKLGENKVIAISGPNGSGKTTLAKILMGLEMPTSGQILYNGIDITDKDVTERAQMGISFGFQQPVCFKGVKVRRILALAAARPATEEQLCLNLQKVGLCAKKYIDREIDSTLSGGEIKRIEIASILARDTPFIVLDEPEAGIDLWSFEKLIDVFEEMRNTPNRTMVIISHQERILKIADEIVLLGDGTVADHGPGPEMMGKMMRKSCPITNDCDFTGVTYHD